MIRPYEISDTQKVMDIWLESSKQAHDFIADDYWEDLIPAVRNYYLPMTDTMVFEDQQEIMGFISILGEGYIGALFVAPEYQNHQIGSKLLRCVQQKYPLLSLKVFAKNRHALSFYQHHGFKIVAELEDEPTGEIELQMSWGLGCKSGFPKRHIGDS